MTAWICKSALRGVLAAPPSKSMAHRLLICAALARGTSTVCGLDYSVDIVATIGALRALGAAITCEGNVARVRGIADGFAGLSGFEAVDCAESGSTLRFMIPLFAQTGLRAELTGAARLFARPLSVYQNIFEEQGLLFCPGPQSVTLQGPLRAGAYALAGDVSSQFVTGLLFALPLLERESRIQLLPPVESKSYINLTLAAQRRFGLETGWVGEHTLLVPAGERAEAQTVEVEGDWSQAVVPAVLAALGVDIQISGLLADSVQGDRVFLRVLERCGARVGWQGGLLCITPPPEGLHAPGEVDLSDCPDLGPVLCALALFCSGLTHFVHAGRLRAKESDRIDCVQAEFLKLGAQISSTQDSITVQGGLPLHAPTGAVLSHNDHRIVMALSAAALGAGLDMRITGAEAICKSWPGFFDELAALGARVDLRGDA